MKTIIEILDLKPKHIEKISKYEIKHFKNQNKEGYSFHSSKKMGEVYYENSLENKDAYGVFREIQIKEGANKKILEEKTLMKTGYELKNPSQNNISRETNLIECLLKTLIGIKDISIYQNKD